LLTLTTSKASATPKPQIAPPTMRAS
jgi:hypothetical protein